MKELLFDIELAAAEGDHDAAFAATSEYLRLAREAGEYFLAAVSRVETAAVNGTNMYHAASAWALEKPWEGGKRPNPIQARIEAIKKEKQLCSTM